MEYTKDELDNIIDHGFDEVAKFRRFLGSYYGDNKNILIKRYKEADMALDILIYFHNECDKLDSYVDAIFRFGNVIYENSLSKEGVFYYLDKICNLESFFDDNSDDKETKKRILKDLLDSYKDDEPKKHIFVTFII